MMETVDEYVLMDDVNDLIKLYNEREIFADHTAHYEQLTNEINSKVNYIRQSAERL